MNYSTPQGFPTWPDASYEGRRAYCGNVVTVGAGVRGCLARGDRRIVGGTRARRRRGCHPPTRRAQRPVGAQVHEAVIHLIGERGYGNFTVGDDDFISKGAMNDVFKNFIDDSADFFVRDNCYKRRARFFAKNDALLRKATFIPVKTARSGAQRFDIALDLGIPGLSSLQAGKEMWFVRASVSKLYRLANPKSVHFELDESEHGREVARQAAETLRHACKRFLFAVASPQDLFDLTYQQRQQFRELDLWPWNELPRLELAGVMAAFLGRTADVREIDSEIRVYAEANGMVDRLPRIIENFEMAGQISKG